MNLTERELQELRESNPEIATANFQDASEELVKIAEKAKKIITDFSPSATVPAIINICTTNAEMFSNRYETEQLVIAGTIHLDDKPVIICSPNILNDFTLKEVQSILIHEMIHAITYTPLYIIPEKGTYKGKSGLISSNNPDEELLEEVITELEARIIYNSIRMKNNTVFLKEYNEDLYSISKERYVGLINHAFDKMKNNYKVKKLT